VTGEWRKLHNKELHDLYSSPSIIRIINHILEDLHTQHSILVLDFIVHLSHYMFWPRLAAIFRWFINTKNIFKVVTI
jgi:hypothetical protein